MTYENTLFKQIATDAKNVIEARRKLLTLMATSQAWDDQQAVVQTLVKGLEASVNVAEVAGLFRTSSDQRQEKP